VIESMHENIHKYIHMYMNIMHPCIHTCTLGDRRTEIETHTRTGTYICRMYLEFVRFGSKQTEPCVPRFHIAQGIGARRLEAISGPGRRGGPGMVVCKASK